MTTGEQEDKSAPKISVIVPVYKVEPYLCKCLDSIVGQSYRNLEIILVDDGSPDNCGAICDKYAAQDERIQVIHKINGGLSSARNAGLEVASGKYIGFVDSDDWIEPKMFETLLMGLWQAEADISVCGRWEEYKDHRIPRTLPEACVMDQERALEVLLQNNELQNSVWDKLYRRELFEEIRFPEGKTYEDMAVMHWLFLQAKRVVHVSQIFYHYLQRANSIMGDISLKARLDHYYTAKQRYEDLAEDWPQFADIMEDQCISARVGLWTVYQANPKAERKKYREEMKTIAHSACIHKGEERRSMGLAGRLVVRLTPYANWRAFALAGIIGRLYQLRHGRML